MDNNAMLIQSACFNDVSEIKKRFGRPPAVVLQDPLIIFR